MCAGLAFFQADVDRHAGRRRLELDDVLALDVRRDGGLEAAIMRAADGLCPGHASCIGCWRRADPGALNPNAPLET